MKNLCFEIGSSIESAIHELLEARTPSEDAQGFFNGVVLIAHAVSTVESMLSDFEASTAVAEKAYWNSPEGKASASAYQRQLKQDQATFDACVTELPKLDFMNQESLLDWYCKLQSSWSDQSVCPSNFVETIRDIFTRNGYLPGVNTGPDIRPADADNVAQYIIGQALLMGMPHQMVHHLTNQWKQKFAKKTA